jgi:sugar lactone lactonase YvrE
MVVVAAFGPRGLALATENTLAARSEIGESPEVGVDSGNAAQFSNPTGVAVDGEGNVYVADQSNHTIRKVTSAGVVTVLAGVAGQSGNLDGAGSAARFYHPTGVAVDTAGNLFVADHCNGTVRKVTLSGVVSTLEAR